MKVLWFANTPCGATEKLTGVPVTGGGWLYALSEQLAKEQNIELHIAFYWKEEILPFSYNGIFYYPILRDGYGSKLGRYIYRLRQQFDKNIDKPEIERLHCVYDEVKPDLVHFHGTEENFALLAERINTPTCISIQGVLSSIFFRLYSGFQRHDVCKLQPLRAKLMLDGLEANERRMKIRVEREKRMLKLVPNILGRTSMDRDCTLALNPKRNYYVCNEILRTEFLSAEWGTPNNGNQFILTTIISSGLFKGLEMIYYTASLLNAAKFNFQWNVIGVSENDTYAKLTRKITSINSKKININLLGRKDALEVVASLQASHAFVQVSHIENSPNSLCEAMALGMPIIASYAGGTASLLEDGKEGVLVQDGDPYRLAGAIIGLERDYNRAIEMGRMARMRAKSRHNPQNVVKELVTVYDKILWNKK
ncbi:MAG: glycosyltransferase [Bacteroidales bacterium]|jgi:glycosyltransferase involved in cell wall biosynthesis|nr:glycosyltransferase [Bacteroidales bacterium]